MTILLAVGLLSVTLPPDLEWADEDQWSPVQQKVERTLTGALIVDTGALLSGRPISLRPVDQSAAWMTRTTLAQLQAWASVPGQQMTLTLRGVARAVVWRHQDPPALKAEPVVQYADVVSGDFYLAYLNLMEI